MLQPLSTLHLPSTTIAELRKKGFLYVEDLLSKPEYLSKFNINKSEIEKQLKVSEVLALDIWQNESQRECISVCSSELEGIFEGGVQCGAITELSGAPFSGKTQICMQLCISVQLSKHYGGLNGRAIYIDTRSGTSVLRLQDIVQGYNNYHKDLNLQEDDAFKNIEIFSPTSLEEFLKMVDNLKGELDKTKNNKKLRLIIIDSLSMLILCCIDDPLKRPHYYSQILHKLHELTLNNEVAVVITNELIMLMNKDGKPYLTAAGGQYVADYTFLKLELTRLTNNKFATRLIKSPMMPEMSVTFMITEDGIRNAV